MTIEELLIGLDYLRRHNSSGDVEVNHIEADRFLLDYINDERVTKAFEAINKWYA